jgi:hypothetical protein
MTKNLAGQEESGIRQVVDGNAKKRFLIVQVWSSRSANWSPPANSLGHKRLPLTTRLPTKLALPLKTVVFEGVTSATQEDRQRENSSRVREVF